MNKSSIISFIYNGKTTAKKGKAVFGSLYMLKHIAVEQHGKGKFTVIADRSNAFWNDDNEHRRQELINDIETVKEMSVYDPAFLQIIIRYELGDGYGIKPKSTPLDSLKPKLKQYLNHPQRNGFEELIKNF